CLQYNSDCWTF
nr:immunoglobulin light chain junction region [Macaca mulatta]